MAASKEHQTVFPKAISNLNNIYPLKVNNKNVETNYGSSKLITKKLERI